MKQLTLSERNVAGFTAIILVAAALGAFSYLQLRTIASHTSHITDDCLSGIYLIGEIETEANKNAVLLTKYLMSKNEDLRANLESQIQSNLQSIATLTLDYRKTLSDDKGRDQFAAFDSLQKSYTSLLNQAIELGRAGKTQEAMELKQGQLDPMFEKFHAEVNANRDRGSLASEQIQHAVATANVGTIVGLASMLLAAVGIAFVINRGVNRILRGIAASLGEGSCQIASAAGQVTSASQTLSKGASDQAASLEETSSSLEEMSTMTKRNAENAQKANDLAKQARAAADKGADDMQAMSAAMETIKSSSNDIAKIIKTIDEIAFQTNILALNAAVEAARAGEAGMGFAVVADEVRNLAQRSAQAAKETAAKIEGAIGNTAQGVEISDKVAQALNEIVTKARQVDELAAEVASASREQTQGITQINEAVSQMDKVTQSNAANAEESAAAAEELNAQAEAMKTAVATVLKLVGGSAQTTTESTVPASPRPWKSHVTNLAVTGNGGAQADPPKPAKRASPPATAGTAAGSHRQREIPLEGDFKDF